MSEKKPGDKYGWSAAKTEIDNKPRRPRLGDVVTIVLGEYQRKEEQRDGKFGPYQYKAVILPCKWNGGTAGFVELTETEFSEVTSKFIALNWPPELPYVRNK